MGLGRSRPSFATGIGALQFNQNTVQVTIGPGAAEGAVSRRRARSGWQRIISVVLTTSAASVPASVQTRRLAGSVVLELRIGALGRSFTRNASVYNPTLYFVNAQGDALIANGINVRGFAWISTTSSMRRRETRV
jgi:hypothetical protein